MTVDGRKQVELQDFDLIVAGYTGRDAEAVQAHIDELAVIGVAPPPAVPMFYQMDPETLTRDCSISMLGTKTSGEVEPVYIRSAGKYYLGIASDHTDRDLETDDVERSKQVCPKPIGNKVIPVTDIRELDLDTTIVASRVDGARYQDGQLASIRRPGDVIDLLLSSDNAPKGDFVCLGGTIPLNNRGFVFGSDWTITLTLPDGTRLQHSYVLDQL